MTRINLIEGAQREFEPAPEPGSASNFQTKVFLVTALAAGVLIGGVYAFFAHRTAVLDKQLAVESAEAAHLAAVRAVNDRYKAQLADIERRMMAIQALEANRQGPSELMTLVANAVNRAPGLFLQSVQPKDNKLQFAGSSRSVTAIAGLVAALETTADVHDVQLRDFYEDDDKDGSLSYKFDLDCVFEPGAGSGTATAPASPAGPGQHRVGGA
jgi:Tfp pilus assembly protein PilN